MYSNKKVKPRIPFGSNVRASKCTYFSSLALLCSVYQIFLYLQSTKRAFPFKSTLLKSMCTSAESGDKWLQFKKWTFQWLKEVFYLFFEPVRWCQQRSCSWPGLHRAGSWFGWQWWWHGTPPPPPAADQSNQTLRLPWSWFSPLGFTQIKSTTTNYVLLLIKQFTKMTSRSI